jgi:hypothetical protein
MTKEIVCITHAAPKCYRLFVNNTEQMFTTEIEMVRKAKAMGIDFQKLDSESMAGGDPRSTCLCYWFKPKEERHNHLVE